MEDYSQHDARLTKVIPFGRPERRRPWSWTCIHCRKEGPGYATLGAAIRGAERHNGGAYNRGESR